MAWFVHLWDSLFVLVLDATLITTFSQISCCFFSLECLIFYTFKLKLTSQACVNLFGAKTQKCVLQHDGEGFWLKQPKALNIFRPPLVTASHSTTQLEQRPQRINASAHNHGKLLIRHGNCVSSSHLLVQVITTFNLDKLSLVQVVDQIRSDTMKGKCIYFMLKHWKKLTMKI